MPEARKATKKPITVETMQWDGGTRTFLAISSWVNHTAKFGPIHENGDVVIGTLEDGSDGGPQVEHVASLGDWIIKGTAGEFWPVKPDVFAATYDLDD